NVFLCALRVLCGKHPRFSYFLRHKSKSFYRPQNTQKNTKIHFYPRMALIGTNKTETLAVSFIL
ncbi:MAG: hypothetical protein WCI51_12575, partial [Lentisphaerota bacterium]